LKGRERWKWDGEKKMVENGLCSNLSNREVTCSYACMHEDTCENMPHLTHDEDTCSFTCMKTYTCCINEVQEMPNHTGVREWLEHGRRGVLVL
jgi:hypothetical protein